MDLKHLRSAVSRARLRAERKRLAARLRKLKRGWALLQREMSAYDHGHECQSTCCNQPEWHKINSAMAANRGAYSHDKSRLAELDKFYQAVFCGKHWCGQSAKCSMLAEEFAISPLEELARAAK